MKSRLLTYAFILLLTTFLHANEATEEAARQFQAALKSVDRIVLVRTRFDMDPEAETNPTIPEITGGSIPSLGETIELKGFDGECLCLTSPEIHFYQGTTYRFSMTLHHGHRLRCKDGPWAGDSEMTEASAARFRTWFAQHGYNGFAQEYELAEKWVAKQREQKIRLLAHFPERIRSLFPKEDDYGRIDRATIDQLIAATPRRIDLILICWRGLGELQAWNTQQTRRPYESLIFAALGTADEEDFKNALAALTPDDTKAWIGAYQHSINSREKETPIKKAMNDEWLARLAERTFHDGAEDERWSIIRKLGEQSNEPSVRLLFQIAQTCKLPPHVSPPRQSGSYYCASSTQALFMLSRLHRNEARPLIVAALTTANTPEDIVTLEVSLAQFDGPRLIQQKHLNSDVFGVARTAWEILSRAPDFNPSIELLILATNSKCYEARTEAAVLLRKRGLRALSIEEQAETMLAAKRFGTAKTIRDLDRIISDFQKERGDSPHEEVDQQILGRLLHRRATLHLAEGKFDEARADLKFAYNEPKECADLAYILQTLGRFDEASQVQRREMRRETLQKPVAEFLERRAFLHFAQGDYISAAKDFTASKHIDFKVPDNRPLFRHLALILAEKPDKTGVAEWDQTNIYGAPLEDHLYWPDTGMRLLQGKLAEPEVLQRINSARNRDTDDLCEAHFVISVLRRVKNDTAGEQEHLRAALATKRYTSQAFSLATVRLRELELQATAKL